jgi:thiosulfate/3-mercaptopyruvate sulfurtransferase
MNGAKNVPYSSIVDKENNCLLDTESLKGVFKEAGIDLSKPLVATCGSGICQ